MIIDQRSEVEQFFLEALEQIKEEIRKKVAIEKKQKRPGVSQIGGTSTLGGEGSVDGGPTTS